MKTNLELFRLEAMAIENRAMEETVSAFARNTYMAITFRAHAEELARVADRESAERQRLTRDPKAFAAAFISQRISGPSADDMVVLLEELHAYLRARTELEDTAFHIEHAAAELRAAIRREEERRAADLDAPAAARSDDEYSRKIDAGLIGRGDFLPERG